MRRFVGLAVAAGIALGAAPALAKEVVITHLTYTSHGAKYHEYLEKKAREFERLNPDVKIDIIIGVHAKFDTMLAGGAPPDVFDLPDYEHLGPQGMLVDVRPLLERDNLSRLFNKEILQIMAAPNGGVYSVPFELSTMPTFFNRDLFREAGLMAPDELGKDWTWDAVLSAGKKMTVDRNGDGVPETFGVDRPWAMWRNAVHQAGGKFYDSPMNPTRSLWNTPEVLRGIEYVRQVYVNKITPHLTVKDQENYYFWTGKTGIDLVDGPGIIGTFLENRPFEWDFALQPAGPGGRAAATGAAGPHIVRSTKVLQETWEWVKYYTTRKENVDEFVRLTGRVPALVASQPTYPVVMNINRKNFRYIFEQTLQPNPYRYALPPELNPRRIDLTPVWNGSKAPQIFLEEIHRQTTAAIAELNKR